MKKLLVDHVRIYTDGGFQEGRVLVSDGKFQKIRNRSGESEVQEEDCEILDGKGMRMVPGFIDIHTHGAVGVDVNAAEKEDLRKVAAFFATQGVTAWNASIVTDSEENTLRCLKTIRDVSREEVCGARLLGSHLEGPFLSKEYKGSMPEHLLREGDEALLARYREAAQESLRYLTLAPEVAGVLPLLKKVAPEIPVALGHSGADYETGMEAFALGARAVTHTFNGMILFHQHRPSLMGAALTSDCFCEAICDGRHLHPGTVRMLIKCKTPEKVVAITDSIMAAGLPDGAYKLGVNDVVVENGDAKLKSNGVRAGSTLTLAQALRNLVRYTQKPPEALLPLLTINPATVLGIQDRKGEIREGMDADFVLLDEDLQVQVTAVEGRVVYQR